MTFHDLPCPIIAPFVGGSSENLGQAVLRVATPTYVSGYPCEFGRTFCRRAAGWLRVFLEGMDHSQLVVVVWSATAV